jgi:TatA/E family protein of Tat protein translocase
MFGTMGISELIIIVAIVLIIFGAGRLPQIGEGVGKALKGFKKEVHDIPPPVEAQPQQDTVSPQSERPQPTASTPIQPPAASPATTAVTPNVPYAPGPEMTPGTTASLLYKSGPQSPRAPDTSPHRDAQAVTAPAQHVVSMEERAATPASTVPAQYPPLPPGARAKPAAKRPSAIVNKDAVARVQAQQAALKARATQAPSEPSDDMQSLGESMGDVVRTFRQAVTDVRSSAAPEMRTIQSEMDAAQKDFQQTLDAATEPPPVQEDPPKSA